MTTTNSNPAADGAGEEPAGPGVTLGSSAVPGDTPLVLELTHAELTEKILRTYLAGFGSGYLSALGATGVPIPLANNLTNQLQKSVLDDPIARNAQVDCAIAAFHNNPDLMPATAPGEAHPSVTVKTCPPDCGCQQGTE